MLFLHRAVNGLLGRGRRRNRCAPRSARTPIPNFVATSHAILTALIGVIEGVRAVESSKTVAHRGTRIYAHLRTCNGCPDAPRARLLARFLRRSAAGKTAAAAGSRAESMAVHSTVGPGGARGGGTPPPFGGEIGCGRGRVTCIEFDVSFF